MNLLINHMKTSSAVLYKCQNIIKMHKVLEKIYSIIYENYYVYLILL